MPTVIGRTIGPNVVSITEVVGALVIRVDVEDDPTFWLEISITEIELLAALARVHAKTHGPGARGRRETIPFDGSY